MSVRNKSCNFSIGHIPLYAPTKANAPSNRKTTADIVCNGSCHVETVVLLSHKKPDGHINVKVEFGEGEGKVPLDNIAKRAESYKPKES